MEYQTARHIVNCMVSSALGEQRPDEQRTDRLEALALKMQLALSMPAWHMSTVGHSTMPVDKCFTRCCKKSSLRAGTLEGHGGAGLNRHEVNATPIVKKARNCVRQLLLRLVMKVCLHIHSHELLAVREIRLTRLYDSVSIESLNFGKACLSTAPGIWHPSVG